MSANFLIILLDCIEKWALTFQFQDEGDSKKENEFYKSYQSLLDKGVKFPSTFKQQKQLDSPDRKDTMAQVRTSIQSNSSMFQSNMSQQQPAVVDNSDTTSQQSITPEKKNVIQQLKKKMQKVKESAKNAKLYLERGFEDNPQELLAKKAQFEEAMMVGTESVNELMSDDISPHVSNSEQLLEKMFSYQEVLTNVMAIINENLDAQNKIQKQF